MQPRPPQQVTRTVSLAPQVILALLLVFLHSLANLNPLRVLLRPPLQLLLLEPLLLLELLLCTPMGRPSPS